VPKSTRRNHQFAKATCYPDGPATQEPTSSATSTSHGSPRRASIAFNGLTVELPSHPMTVEASPELCSLLAALIRRRHALLKNEAAA
jgi:hypothetical protein